MRPVIVAAALVGLIATLMLGNWQRHKAERRTVLQERIVLALQDAPEVLSGRVSDPARLIWHRIRAEGIWEPRAVVYLDNRPNLGRAGFYVLMPLRLADGSVLVVNRGWLPRDPMERTRIAPYQTPPGPVVVEGLVLADEDRFLELAPAGELKTGTIWENFDYAAFARASGFAPLACIVREDSAATDGLLRSWPDRGNVFEKQIERNRGYAFQWYAMSAAILALSLFYGFRNARSARSTQP